MLESVKVEDSENKSILGNWLCLIQQERHELKVEFHLFGVQILRYVQMGSV